MAEGRHGRVFPGPDHDHGPCLQATLTRAAERFAKRGLRLTPLRLRVLQEIASSHQAVGAYEILERLARKSGPRLAPISIYRALDALLDAGVVHRLESRNAFFACLVPHTERRNQIILACERCGTVAEVPGERVFQGINGAAQTAGFSPSRSVVEVAGSCGRCAAAART